MTPPKLPKPPVFGDRATDQWFTLLYKWLGDASGASALKAANITEQLDVGSQVTGEMATGNLVPNAQTNVTNFATVDSIDAGTDATIRVYGPGGIGTPWTRVVGTVTTGPYPSATFPGFPYNNTREVYFRQRDNSFFLYDSATQNLESLADDLLWIGRVKTVSAGGTGGEAGGGGPNGGSGGGRYNMASIL